MEGSGEVDADIPLDEGEKVAVLKVGKYVGVIRVAEGEEELPAGGLQRILPFLRVESVGVSG